MRIGQRQVDGDADVELARTVAFHPFDELSKNKGVTLGGI